MALTVSRPHRALMARPLRISSPHRAEIGSVLRVTRPHRANASNKVFVRRPHRAKTSRVLYVSRPHGADVGELIPPVTVLPLTPDGPGEPYVPENPEALEGLHSVSLLERFRRPKVLISTPGSVIETGAILASAELTSQINGACTGELVYHGLQGLDFAEEAIFRINFHDGAGHALLSPEMVAEKRKRSESFGGPTTTYQLIDVASWRLSAGGRSLPTFVRQSSANVLGAVGQEWGVRFANPPAFPILEEDVKDSGGWDAALRYAAVAGMNILPDRKGILRFIDCMSVSSDVEMTVSEITEEFTPSLSYTGFSAVKTSTQPPGGLQTYFFDRQGFASFALKAPLRNPVPRNRSVTGGVALVAFWAGAPNVMGSSMVSFHHMSSQYTVNLSIPSRRHLVATHVTLSVLPAADNRSRIDARLEVSGSNPEPGFPGCDFAFVVHHGTGRRMSIWREQTLPSKAYVQARAAKYLFEASKKARPLTYSGRMDLRMGPTCCLVRGGLGRNRAESVTHSWRAGQAPETSARAVMM